MYSIVQAPNEILRTAAKPVDFTGLKLAKLIREMTKILIGQQDPEGVGLAANQIGLPYRLFVARFGTRKNQPVRAFINPVLLAHSEETQPEDDKKSPLEGCLSLPKYYGIVKRFKSVKLKYQDENCKLKIENFEGFAATVIQHEMDHLDGKIFVERILEQNGKLYRVVKRGKSAQGRSPSGGEEWAEVEI
jgi:peptide deformylase